MMMRLQHSFRTAQGAILIAAVLFGLFLPSTAHSCPLVPRALQGTHNYDPSRNHCREQWSQPPGWFTVTFIGSCTDFSGVWCKIKTVGNDFPFVGTSQDYEVRVNLPAPDDVLYGYCYDNWGTYWIKDPVCVAQALDMAGQYHEKMRLVLAAAMICGLSGPGCLATSFRSISIATRFLRALYDEQVKLAADPPDPNFESFYQYSSPTIDKDWGLSPTGNAHFNQTLTKLARMLDAKKGELTSTERGQGALAAVSVPSLTAEDGAIEDSTGAFQSREFDLFNAQQQASKSFAIDSQDLSNELSALISALPAILAAEGLTDVAFDPAVLEAALDELQQNGLTQEQIDRMVAITGDPNAGVKFVDDALSLRGFRTQETLFSSLQALGAVLRLADCGNGRDDDGDGLSDLQDPDCTSTSDESEGTDTDGDGILDGVDNCTLEPNAAQVDADHDGFGNRCDADLTNDGIVNFGDLAKMKSVFFKADPAADLNGDGVVNFADLAILKARFFKAPGPAAVKPL